MGDRYSSETMNVLRISFLSSFALELAATISVAVIAVEIGLRLVAGSMHLLPALAILILAPEIYFPLRNAAALFHSSVDGAEALEQVRRLQSGTNTIENKQIKLDDVHFQFWVGPSGSGKTTKSMELISSIEPGKLSWIPQSPRLATGSVRKQFTLINSKISDSEIIESLDEVGLRIVDLPNGLETLLEAGNELTTKVSGGQLRKIAIARALAKECELLIADEPTADLDHESAIKVISKLKSSKAKQVIVITHDVKLIDSEDFVVEVGPA